LDKVLSTPVTVNFTEEPLSKVTDFVSRRDKNKIDVSIDKKALDEMGIEVDAPVSIKVHDMPLRSALNLMLRPLGLTWFVRDKTLVITTPEAAEQALLVKVYPVADLTEDLHQLSDLISASLAPTTWDNVGGPGAIRAIGRETLVISQTQAVHDRVADFLAVLRAVASQPAAKLPAAVSHEGYWRRTEQTDRIRAALEKKLTVEFKDVKLEEVLNYLREQSKVDVVLDHKSLEETGMDPKMPVTVKQTDATLARILDLMLGDLHLGYTVDSDAIIITSHEMPENYPTVAVYPVGDFISSEQRDKDFDELIGLLQDTIAPTSWDASGGPGSVWNTADIADALIICQTTEVHRRIAEFLAELRDTRKTDAQTPKK
jgi:hypothetical protein